MRLLCTFAAIIALSLAESEQNNYDDLVAMETMELKKTRDLKPEASVYSSFTPRNTNWNIPNQNNNWNIPNNWNQPNNNWNIPNNWDKPNNNWNIPTYAPPTWNPPQNPVSYIPGPVTFPPPPGSAQNDYVPPQNNYYPQQTWTTPNYHQSTTTTPIPVIKNEQYYGDNGSYKYEYKIGDGTHVGEEGYFSDPKGDEESLVKKGWYSYQGGDGKTYTVTYWADKTGFHAYGDHLPTPPTPHPAIQAAIDKENAENNKPQTGNNPQTQPQNPGTYYPPQQPIYPSQQTNYPSQQTNYPSQQTNYPSQQTNYPSQQTNYPSQQTNYPSQQTNYPSQQTYYPPQQSGYGK